MDFVALPLRCRSATCISTFEPAGMVAPLDPTTALLTEPLNLSPVLFVFVHTLSSDVKLIDVPDGIVPNVTSLPAGVTATLLPEAVVVLSGVPADDAAGAD